MPSKQTTRPRGSREVSEDDLDIRPVAKADAARTFVLYGRSGTGKTTLAASFPKPALLLDFKDEGTDSVSDVKDLYVKKIGEVDDLEDLYWYVKKNPKKYKTIILDTMTALQSMVVIDVAGEAKKDKAGEWGSMRKQDWGDVARAMRKYITNFRDLAIQHGLNIVFIAQDRTFNAGEENDEDAQLAPEVGPALSPSTRSHLNAAVSAICNTFLKVKYVTKEVNGKKKERRRIVYCLRLGPNPVYDTKIRKPKVVELPDHIEDPSYDDIIEVIEGGNNAERQQDTSPRKQRKR
jgi:hypothetical protein